MSSKISEAMTELWSDPERRKTQSEKMKAKWASMTEEEKQARRDKQSAAMTKRWGTKNANPSHKIDYELHPDYMPGLPMHAQSPSVHHYIAREIDKRREREESQ